MRIQNRRKIDSKWTTRITYDSPGEIMIQIERQHRGQDFSSPLDTLSRKDC